MAESRFNYEQFSNELLRLELSRVQDRIAELNTKHATIVAVLSARAIEEATNEVRPVEA